MDIWILCERFNEVEVSSVYRESDGFTDILEKYGSGAESLKEARQLIYS